MTQPIPRKATRQHQQRQRREQRELERELREMAERRVEPRRGGVNLQRRPP